MSIDVQIYPIPSDTLPKSHLPLLSVLHAVDGSYFAQFLKECDSLRKEEWAHHPPLILNTFSEPRLLLYLPDSENRNDAEAADADCYFFLRAKEFRKISLTDERYNRGMYWDQAIVAYLASLPETFLVLMKVGW